MTLIIHNILQIHLVTGLFPVSTTRTVTLAT
nr:MAG TPA: hypothetical protein [Caudoviricetes sp.]DAM09690.1 MAG TPA: hypothetical protein [Caudoviricetes sp.]